MEVSFLDLRKRPKELLRAIARNETITLYYRGKMMANIVSVTATSKQRSDVKEHPYFGMRSDEKMSVEETMQQLRGGRYK